MSVEVDFNAASSFELHIIPAQTSFSEPSGRVTSISKVPSLMTLKPRFSSNGTRRDKAELAARVEDLQAQGFNAVLFLACRKRYGSVLQLRSNSVPDRRVSSGVKDLKGVTDLQAWCLRPGRVFGGHPACGDGATSFLWLCLWHAWRLAPGPANDGVDAWQRRRPEGRYIKTETTAVMTIFRSARLLSRSNRPPARHVNDREANGRKLDRAGAGRGLAAGRRDRLIARRNRPEAS